MRPFIANGELWRVVRVEPGDPRLIDRTGAPKLATADPATRTVSVLASLEPPKLDEVLMHEVAHALTISYGLLDGLHASAADPVAVEEWVAGFVERHGIEAAALASRALGRPICVRGRCHD